MFVAKKHIARRTFLRGAGVTLALPLLESMVPALTPARLTAAAPADAALVFEYCDAEWTGDMAWLESREQLPTSDDGLPNPWEAGNRAAERRPEDHGGLG